MATRDRLLTTETPSSRQRPLTMLLAVRWLVALGLIAGALYLTMPWLRHTAFVVQLLREARPVHLPVPVDGVSARAVTDSWGHARAMGRRHEGVDIFARRGSPVRSTTHGLIWRIGESRLGGTVVWVLGPGGDLHYYAHLDRVAEGAAPRQRIARGTLLGHVGNTGNAIDTPPHLHYGIYRGGIAVNPFPLLRASSPPHAPAEPG
jgi:peptidoglycan LD-endopeptidase LytH